MKVQYIAVIFIIIILPIAMIMGEYINSQITTIKLQTSYDSKLNDATYDAVTAFQINTVNNRYSSVSNSKIRDIEAAINTFYNSLSVNESLSKEEIQEYVPGIVFTLYDGYYIYSKYDNSYPTNNGQPILSTDNTKTQYGLKPYIYYSCRYKNPSGTVDFVVNYTLDNAITIYGKFNGNNQPQTLSGYLINPDAVTEESHGNNPINWSLKYNGIEIKPEILTEHLLFATNDGSGNREQGDYEYLVYNGQKIYYDKGQNKYFWYQNYDKTYINDKTTNTYVGQRTSGGHLYSTSSFEYYYEAKNFSKQVADLTSGIKQENAIDENENQIEFNVETGDAKIFVASNNNDPLLSGSAFNENRMAVIRKSIETNLSAAIGNYGMYSANNYEYRLPILSEIEWEKITNNVSVISFLQGIPIGHKYYNNYCVITNDDNEETVKKNNIYILTQNQTTGEREYHLPGCTHLFEDPDHNLNIIGTNSKEGGAYSNLSFIRQTVRLSEEDYLYFYPQMQGNNNPNKTYKPITSCYYCMVNASNIYDTDQIIQGTITVKNETWTGEKIIVATNGSRFQIIRDKYLTALARERHDLYQTNMDSFNTKK